jgi:hypothetical protein
MSQKNRSPRRHRHFSGWRRDRQSKKRQLIIEALETRLALDGDPMSASQRQDLLNGLSYLANWTDNLAQTSQLSSPLAITGLSVGQSANVAQMITTGIVSHLNTTRKPR